MVLSRCGTIHRDPVERNLSEPDNWTQVVHSRCRKFAAHPLTRGYLAGSPSLDAASGFHNCLCADRRANYKCHLSRRRPIRHPHRKRLQPVSRCTHIVECERSVVRNLVLGGRSRRSTTKAFDRVHRIRLPIPADVVQHGVVERLETVLHGLCFFGI